MKLPEFHGFEDWPGEGTLLDQFLFVNRTLREKNNALILGLGGQSKPEMFWQEAFGRLPNSAQQAGFADHRLYRYNGEIIDEATHLGIDLASVQQAPVPAANAGRILKVDYIGIYGNTVIIDHGFGLFSLYSHLSKTLVDPGDMVAKGDIIGHTGISGWAGGDHLHFSMIVDHVFVNPVEWWDPAWIQNNVMDKLDTLVSEPSF
jgi:murein DD-endopeptidase MepM/ murein hydrolase activator NlpD